MVNVGQYDLFRFGFPVKFYYIESSPFITFYIIGKWPVPKGKAKYNYHTILEDAKKYFFEGQIEAEGLVWIGLSLNCTMYFHFQLMVSFKTLQIKENRNTY